MTTMPSPPAAQPSKLGNQIGPTAAGCCFRMLPCLQPHLRVCCCAQQPEDSCMHGRLLQWSPTRARNAGLEINMQPVSVTLAG